MMTSVSAEAADGWLLPILRELLGKPALEKIESTVGTSYWRTAVDSGAVTDAALLAALSRHTRFRLANELVVSATALQSVPEDLARRFGVLPLAISDSVLDVATSNPYDLDCEQLLAFVTRRRVRISLATPDRIQERIEEVYAPVDRVSKILDRAAMQSAQPVIEKF